MSKILFILKRKEDSTQRERDHKGLSTGLFNSSSFVDEMLINVGIESVVEVAIDNNCIDRLVTKHRPSHVIIEALWVVPQKFDVLKKLHPTVTWVIRLHSEIPFMAGEGMAMNWIGEYARYDNIVIAPNAPRMHREALKLVQFMHGLTEEQASNKIKYLPNYYPQTYTVPKHIDYEKDHVDIGCFGAVRLLKNHLLQAIAAVEFAESVGKRVHFHINGGRIEMQGQPVAQNLEHLFAHLYSRGHRLINHTWSPREDFLKICAQMDVGMQCNFSETFNIVGADLISQGVPLVGTTEIPWLASGAADSTDSQTIVSALTEAYRNPTTNVLDNQRSLTAYTTETVNHWVSVFGI